MTVDIREIADHPVAGWFDDPEVRVEGQQKVRGQARFSADVRLPGMLYAEFLSSPHPHAHIVSINTTAAKRVPGVHAVLTGADIGEHRYGRSYMDMPALAIERVRFIGERVAAVAAETREAALEAVSLIEVEYEVLPAIFDRHSALAADAPVLHPNREQYRLLLPAAKAVPHPNVQGYALNERGDKDLDAVFARCDYVREDVYTYPRQHQGYIEPHATVVSVEPDGTARFYASNKNPFRLRYQLSLATGLPVEQIVVNAMHVGGDFGGKGHPMGELPAYYLSKATGRPIKAQMRYVDEMTAGNPRHETEFHLKTGVMRDGTIVAHQWTAYYYGGAYIAPKPSVWPSPSWSAVQCYAIPNTRQEQFVLYTNTVPAGHVRAPGEAQMAAAGECHIDDLARDIGMDPLAFRLENALRDGEVDPAGEHVRNPQAVALLETIKREANWSTPLPPDHGRGVAIRMRHVGQGKTEVLYTLLPDGRIEVLYGTPDQGSGSATVIRRIASRVLDVAPERIVIRYGDTSEAPEDAGAGASRVTHIVGRAALEGASTLKERLQDLAAEVMGWPGGEVRIEGDQFVVGSNGAREAASFQEVAERILRSGELKISSGYNSEEHHVAEEPHEGDYNFCAYAIDVRVDRETGQVIPLQATLAYDVGQIINPIGHQGQLDGSFVYGLGNALMEEMPVEDGRVVTANLNDYKLPTQMDTIPLRTLLVQTDIGPGPFGAKAAGEAVNAAVGAALSNAVRDALGVRITTLPVTAERVRAALEAQSGD